MHLSSGRRGAVTIKQLFEANLVSAVEPTLETGRRYVLVQKDDIKKKDAPMRLAGIHPPAILFTAHAVLEIINRHEAEVKQAAITRAGRSDSQ
jgi:hypothetical protein